MTMPAICASEILHTMSLIHDDLPAMDMMIIDEVNCPTIRFMAKTLLFSLVMNFLAYTFEFIVVQTKGVPVEYLLQVVTKLSYAVATTGLVGGQVVDLESEGLKILI